MYTATYTGRTCKNSESTEYILLQTVVVRMRLLIDPKVSTRGDNWIARSGPKAITNDMGFYR